MRVIGTAGHVDHGKSALVYALTGINPDRLKEEVEREMTIDLGFAWLTLPSGREASIVDVPGHEDFIKNMLAGVGGIDLALLVIAADEGVMPQTREHLAILDLLQVQDGVVALSKTDLVQDPEWLDLVHDEVREELAETVLQDVAIVPVSARTGQGLTDLVEEIDHLLAIPAARRETGRPRLPVDRVFTVSGFGTVVTGTLIEGQLCVGDEVELLPRQVRARIRGLQTHKNKVDIAVPPSRVAVNLTGASKEQLSRGDVLTTPGWLRATSRLDARLELLKHAPRAVAHNAMVDFYTGSAQCQARLRVLDRKEIAPGEAGWVQFMLSEPVAALKGDRYIIRQPSPSVTLGGGVIVDPRPRRRHRRFRPELLERLERLAYGTPREILLQELERDQPCEIGALLKGSTLPTHESGETLLALLNDGAVLLLDTVGEERLGSLPMHSQYVMSARGWEALLGQIQSLLRDYHQHHPLRAGMPREELKSRLGLSTRTFIQAVARATSQGALAATETTLALPSHQVVLSPEQQRQVRKLLAAFAADPYSPPTVSESEAIVGPGVLAALIEQGDLVKVNDAVLFSAEAYKDMTKAVTEHLGRDGQITLAQARDMFATSRKYAQAFLEHLDDKRITKRVGDARILL
jgi:selenocysteine-specific elongation factor